MRHESRKGGEEGQGARHTPKEHGVVNRCGGVGWYLGASFLGRAGADHRVSVCDGLCFKAKRKM